MILEAADIARGRILIFGMGAMLISVGCGLIWGIAAALISFGAIVILYGIALELGRMNLGRSMQSDESERPQPQIMEI